MVSGVEPTALVPAMRIIAKPKTTYSIFFSLFPNRSSINDSERQVKKSKISDMTIYYAFFISSLPDNTKNDSIITAIEISIRLGPAGLMGTEALWMTVKAGVASCSFAVAA